MMQAIATSVRRKLLVVILATTALTLLMTSIAMLLYEAYAYERTRVNDLTAQAEIVGLASAAAIAFNDPDAAAETLATLRVRPRILAAAAYTAEGRLFATYVNPRLGSTRFPDAPSENGYTTERDVIEMFHPVMENRQVVGTIYLRASFDLVERIATYAAILVLAMLGAMGIALLIATRLERTFTQPILAVTEVANHVVASRDFSLRANKTTRDEIGVLVDAFNDMLREVGERTRALEEANRALALEMDVRRSAESKLRQADRRKDEFLAMLAHELRNPLAPISAAAQLLRIGQLDEGRTRQTSELIARQVDHLTSLVNDLLDVSRVTRGLIVLERQTHDMKHILADAVEQVRPLLTLRQHRLEQQMSPAAGLVNGDEKRLVQVIANLLNNAAKYTPAGGQIVLRLDVEPGMGSQDGDGGEYGEVVVSVRDNGIGMDADLQANVFELFTQAQRSSDRSQGGLGLGLALVKNIVELHGGSVTAYSAGDGKGSEFVVRLPRVREAAALPGAGAGGEFDPGPPASGRDGLRVLVVDDNRDAADTLAAYLQTAGHEVHVEYGSAAALVRARNLRPAVCLLDIGLPGMDGYALARALRQMPGMAQAVLIAVTGYGQKQDRDEALAAGFDRHMVKPVDARGLVELLAEVAGGGRAAVPAR